MSGPQLKCPSAYTSLGANRMISPAQTSSTRSRAFDADARPRPLLLAPDVVPRG